MRYRNETSVDVAAVALISFTEWPPNTGARLAAIPSSG